ncbi:hypothetical protein EK21DRAFT_90642 [Setomelanomma holmii]|uniref:Uncharacterized protein n=1 Tax=Setomelanomma holmii TaxID=210430 RepID=A0A9P4LLC3_9PLEO|nr:hypothetical protein EK21DRAFT_90642 [Setomelanomma holmii]
MPSDTANIYYIYSALITRKHHTVVLKVLPNELSFEVVLQSSNVQLLATCKKIYEEANYTFRTAIQEIIQSPARIVACTSLAVSDYLMDGVLNALIKRIAEADRILETGQQPTLEIVLAATYLQKYCRSQRARAILGTFIMRATLHARFDQGHAPVVVLDTYT